MRCIYLTLYVIKTRAVAIESDYMIHHQCLRNAALMPELFRCVLHALHRPGTKTRGRYRKLLWSMRSIGSWRRGLWPCFQQVAEATVEDLPEGVWHRQPLCPSFWVSNEIALCCGAHDIPREGWCLQQGFI